MADKKGGKSKSAKYYSKNPKAKAKKAAYDKKYHSTPKRRKYRADLNKKNREAGTYGNGDGKDVSHKKGGGTTSESRSKNRARQGAGGKAKKK
jgi:hypothetical protein